MAPVHFNIDTPAAIQPYYISPWQNEGLKEFGDPVLVPLRGDFFCLPFGANVEEVNGERHSVHGEAASAKWGGADVTEDQGITTLTLDLKTTVRKGRITKRIHLLKGQNVVYTSHTPEGYSGKMPIGHHCNIAVPEEEDSIRIAVSAFEMGMTPPTIVSNPVNREYQSLAIDAAFTKLAQVPVLWKDTPPADCTRFPRRTGFTDLLQIFKRPSPQPAWTAAVCPGKGYLWFSLKDASMLPGTVLWISNRGRHGSPWNGRNRCLGLEETCSFFAEGLAQSISPNPINEAGFPTALELSANRPTSVNFIQGAARIPSCFTDLKEVRFDAGKAVFVSTGNEEVTVDVDHQFLRSGTFAT